MANTHKNPPGVPSSRRYFKKLIVLAGGMLVGVPGVTGATELARAPSASSPKVESPRWPTSTAPLARPWQPADKMVCQQNPPDFSWPAIADAVSYDLQVCRDAAGTDIAFRADALTHNFHNFSEIFPAGTYYWRLRFHTASGTSSWSESRRFRVDPEAWKFPVPPVDDLLKRVQHGHPRVWVTPETLPAFRARAQGASKAWFDPVLARVRQEMSTPLPTEPVFPFAPGGPRTTEWLAAHLRLREHGWDGYGGASVRLLRTAFCYLVTGDQAIGRHAVAQLLNFATWDPNGATGYATHDQVHRSIALYSAMAYDWCYDVMTPAERDIVLAMVETRTRTMAKRMLVGRPLNEAPYDSHAWTAFGYVGAIAIATLHDLPDAIVWFKAALPAYINTLPPWGDEDGGWSQGPNYWQYSQRSNRELADALLSATGFSLYDKAFFHNNAYFPLYAFPHGSPRSHFGDGNEYVPAKHSADHFLALANLYRDPVLKWAARALGDAKIDQQEDYLGGTLRDYFTFDDTLTAEPPPPDFPRSRWYRDIDWVTMHSDLVDPERVSLYFKSSPYGSHNHSHADQNSFVLNAYGEALAIDAGYYDSYGTPHDTTFTRQTLAHNAITHDGGFGQPIFDITAKGDVTGFVTSDKIDACTGDATPAYKGDLTRAVRHIIYLRPATFIVIDDLASPKTEMKFEWWLHALDQLDLHSDHLGATITRGRAALRVRFAYPESLDAQKRTEFIGPPNAYPPEQKPAPVKPAPLALGDLGTADQVHAWFTTSPTRATQVVAVLQATRVGSEPTAFTSQRVGNALELNFADGAKVIVRLQGDEKVTAGGLTFRGAAAARVGDTTLLVQGDRLQRDGRRLVSSLSPITTVIEPQTVSWSSMDDTTVQFGLADVTELRDECDRLFDRTLWSAGRNRITVKSESGAHTLHVRTSLLEPSLTSSK